MDDPLQSPTPTGSPSSAGLSSISRRHCCHYGHSALTLQTDGALSRVNQGGPPFLKSPQTFPDDQVCITCPGQSQTPVKEKLSSEKADQHLLPWAEKLPLLGMCTGRGRTQANPRTDSPQEKDVRVQDTARQHSACLRSARS